MATQSDMVREFTEGAMGKTCPSKPEAMTRDEVEWIVEMIITEVVEMLQPTHSLDKIREVVAKAVDKDLTKEYSPPSDPVDIIAEQFDAMVDIEYYMENMACRKGTNLSGIFRIVHAANMAKRDPTTGEFIRRESDGKVLKPPGWQPPDVRAEILRQMGSDD